MKPETIEQQAGIKLLMSVGAAVYVNGSKRPRPNPECETCRRNQTSRQTPGIPDVHAFVPVRGTSSTRLLMWECKAPTGKPSPAQADYGRRCQTAGVWHVIGPSVVLEQALRLAGVIR